MRCVPESIQTVLRRGLWLAILFIAGSVSAYSQTTACPSNLVCISPEAAKKALQDSDLVVAQQKELTAKDQAIADFQKELNNLRIELAKAIGEKTGAEQMVVRQTAIIDILLKGQKKKCLPFSVCVF